MPGVEAHHARRAGKDGRDQALAMVRLHAVDPARTFDGDERGTEDDVLDAAAETGHDTRHDQTTRGVRDEDVAKSAGRRSGR